MNIKTLAASGALLVACAACGSSGATSVPIATSSGAAVPAAPGGSASASGVTNGSPVAANPTPITERDFKFDTPDVSVTGTVVLAVTNAGPTVHDLTIRNASGRVLGETSDLRPGTSETMTVDLPAGSYTIFCSLPGHESLGLKGTLTVKK